MRTWWQPLTPLDLGKIGKITALKKLLHPAQIRPTFSEDSLVVPGCLDAWCHCPTAAVATTTALAIDTVSMPMTSDCEDAEDAQPMPQRV